jgi:FlaA1/EpsC-like NDP-sugar epimerase
MELTLESVLGRTGKRSILALEDFQYLEGKIVLITGGAGSIGFRLARTILRGTLATQVILLDIDESRLHSSRMSLDPGSRSRTKVHLGDIRDAISTEIAIRENSPNVVIHAAALKHVSVLEAHAREAFLTNVIGTANLLKAIQDQKIQNLVFISTDKAANPSNELGRSKLIGELMVSDFAHQNPSVVVSAVRFGNVFLSRGSVLETFMNQIQHNEDITVTDAEVTRYFIDLDEASELICKVLGKSQSGISILKMGDPIRILDVALNLVRITDSSSKIVFIGLKQGEKLHEDLYTGKELEDANDIGEFWNVQFLDRFRGTLSHLGVPSSNLEASLEMRRIIDEKNL